MSDLSEYIKLYGGNREMICSNSASPLNALRRGACEALEARPLPKRGSENFDTIDLPAIFAEDYGLNLMRINMDVNPADTFRCDVPVGPGALFLNINDIFRRTDFDCDTLPEGVTADSLCSRALSHPGEIERYYGTLADNANPVSALNTLFAQDGLYIHVAKGARCEKPVQLINILSAAAPLMAVRRVLIVVDDDAALKMLVCDHTQRDDVKLMALETVEIFVGRNASLEYYDLEESTESTTRLSTLYLQQQEGSNVNIASITLFNGVTRNEFYCRFAGSHARLQLNGMAIEDNRRVISTYSHIDHAVAGCKSDELFKYSADDEAQGSFTGRILVASGASHSEAYQASRNLVNSDKAKIFSKPQLEIYNDDVKCSHGCAIGQLDETQLFYMRTRGIAEADARLLLRKAFMSDVIDKVEIPALRDRLHLLVERRFAGAESACAACAGCNKKS
ncbi:MAG: Fe-S cluster assembly protein SufD [Candidatus Amulumruptor caecigallinarius]|nr:Fe-S cluster assembly protein SufD [Candidatus Amulumruptor caecigallinarius]